MEFAGLVSVIIPAYNAAQYISGCIASVLNQTYPHFEIIVVDDASQDDTYAKVKSFTDPRIRLLRHNCNIGPGAARNTALNAARGKWVALLDADDRWLPDRLEQLTAVALEAGDKFMVADRQMKCFDTPSGLIPWKKLGKTVAQNVQEYDFETYLRSGLSWIKPLIPLQPVIAGGIYYHPFCRFGEDHEFYCRLFLAGLKLRLCSRAMYLYRITPGSLTSSEKRYAHVLPVYDRLLSEPGCSEAVRALLVEHIDRINHEKTYRTFPLAIKKGRLSETFCLFYKHPWVLGEFLKRAPISLRYRFRAWRVRGRLR